MIYLIDFENVKTEGLAGIEMLNSTDLLVIFLSPACGKTINVETLSACKAPIHFVKCTPDGHKNYMDFQIVTSATVFITQGKEVCIISSDKGFLSICDFWKNNNLFELRSNVLLRSSLKNNELIDNSNSAVLITAVPKQPKQKKKTKSVKSEVKPPAIANEKLEEILKKSKTLSSLKCNLYSTFGKEVGKQLFETHKNKFIDEKLKEILEKSKTQNDLKSRLGSMFGRDTGKQLFEIHKNKYRKK